MDELLVHYLQTCRSRHYLDKGSRLYLYSRLALILLVCPVSSVHCERCFSVMNGGVLTDSRNRLTPENMNKLMLIKMEGPEFSNSIDDMAPTVKLWGLQKERKGLLEPK